VANTLYYGDNLDVLREHIADESVDLVYLDPPFNSKRSYNVIFARRDVHPGGEAAQVRALNDTWRWRPETESHYTDAVGGGVPSAAADALIGMRTLLGENDMTAYLVMLAPRLVELRRVLSQPA
jgi:DNA modification methylase